MCSKRATLAVRARRVALGCQVFTKNLGSAGDVMLREGLENGATLPIFLGN